MTISVDLRNALPDLYIPRAEMSLRGSGASKSKQDQALLLDFISQNFSVASPLTGQIVAFARASVASYFDVAGNIQTAGSGAPRYDFDPVTHVPTGFLVEETRTNLFLNSGSPATQGIAVTAQPYTVSFYGTGTITLSGAATGTINGAGAFPTRTTFTTTPSAGTLTLTLGGSVSFPQVEAGSFATSYIPTSGASVQRLNEVANTLVNSWVVNGKGTFVAVGIVPDSAPATAATLLSGFTGAGSSLYLSPSGNLVYDNGSGTVTTGNAVTFGSKAQFKAALAYSGSNAAICLNAGSVATQSLTVSAASTVYIGSKTGTSNFLNGRLKTVRNFNYTFTSSQLRQITT